MKKNFDFDVACSSLWRKVKEFRYEICSSLFFGLLAYGFYFTNMVYNHDSMNKIVLPYDWYYTLGRWVIDLLAYVFPHPTMPWYDGLVSLCLYTAGICMISSLFQFKNKYTRILLAAVIISFPSFCVEYLYVYQAIYYSLAFVLAVSSVLLWIHAKNVWWHVGAAICVVLCLGLYQGLLTVVSSLMVVFLVKQLLQGDIPPRKVLGEVLTGIAVLVAGVAVYFMLTEAVFLIRGNGFNGYAREAMEGTLPLYKRVLMPFLQMYLDIITSHEIVVTRFSTCAHLLSIICCAYAIIRWMRDRAFGEQSLLLLLLVLFPVSVYFMWFALSSHVGSILVYVGFISIYVLMAVVTENVKVRKWMPNVVKIALCCIIFANVRFANVTAMRTKLLYDHTFSFYTTLVTQIKSSGLLDGQSKLAICGRTDQFLCDIKKKYPYRTWYTGEGVNNYSKQNFVRFLLGFDIPAASAGEKGKIVASDGFKEMPIYPDEGSIRKFGNVIVVKFSHEVKDKH